MTDRHPSLTTVCAIAFWAAGFTTAWAFAVVGTRGLGVFALLLAGVGGVLTIRRFMVTLADDLIARERAAFRLGQDAQRMRAVD